jgi:hypothetical protein
MSTAQKSDPGYPVEAQYDIKLDALTTFFGLGHFRMYEDQEIPRNTLRMARTRSVRQTGLQSNLYSIPREAPLLLQPVPCARLDRSESARHLQHQNRSQDRAAFRHGHAGLKSFRG